MRNKLLPSPACFSENQGKRWLRGRQSSASSGRDEERRDEDDGEEPGDTRGCSDVLAFSFAVCRSMPGLQVVRQRAGNDSVQVLDCEIGRQHRLHHLHHHRHHHHHPLGTLWAPLTLPPLRQMRVKDEMRLLFFASFFFSHRGS